MSDLLWLLRWLRRQYRAGQHCHLEIWTTPYIDYWYARAAESRILSVHSNRYFASATASSPWRALRLLSRVIQQREAGK